MAQFINVQKKGSDILVYCSAGLLLIFFSFGILAPWIAPYDIEQMDLTARLVMPFSSFAHGCLIVVKEVKSDENDNRWKKTGHR